MFTDAASSIPAWTVLLELYETQQTDMNNATNAQDGGVQSDEKLSYELWRTEERVRMLVLDEASCRHLTPQMHGKLWMLLSGANTEMDLRKGHYSTLVGHSSSVRQIEADLTRTVSPDDADWSVERSDQLRRVLVAYAVHNPKLGYCQGLNYVVARLLQCVDDDESAFWLLERMIALLPDDYYTTMLGLAIDQHVFAELVALQTPQIVQHIEALISTDGRVQPFKLSFCPMEHLYPRAHTCFNRLDLPLYESKSEMLTYLIAVVSQDATGFSME
ncbi:hypothetical protein DYB36_000760 [Aphanomyces astaci]|uniref:Rab-GAP TBC domain-containing protein n=1 Tax=Aphanomyces astaci TaxID=112090 RepID=A0A397ASX0_APHAT|nr:hypothetical protein DYB36_000760 [Aphanomyces astaci]